MERQRGIRKTIHRTWTLTSTELPTGYIPNQDQGRFYIAVQLPDAASMERTQQIVDRIMRWPEGTRIHVLAPLVRGRKGEYRKELNDMRRAGFVRVKIDGAPNESFPGHVATVSEQAEYTPRNVQTEAQRAEQVFGVKVIVDPNPRLHAGMAATVDLGVKGTKQ